MRAKRAGKIAGLAALAVGLIPDSGCVVHPSTSMSVTGRGLAMAGNRHGGAIALIGDLSHNHTVLNNQEKMMRNQGQQRVEYSSPVNRVRYESIAFSDSDWTDENSDGLKNYHEINNTTRKIFAKNEAINVGFWVENYQCPSSAITLSIKKEGERNPKVHRGNNCWAYKPNDMAVGTYDLTWFVYDRPVITDRIQVVQGTNH